MSDNFLEVIDTDALERSKITSNFPNTSRIKYANRLVISCVSLPPLDDGVDGVCP
jgi:hypothetical protein